MKQYKITSDALCFEHKKVKKVVGGPSLVHALLKPRLVADLLGEERESLLGNTTRGRQHGGSGSEDIVVF